MDTGLSVAGVVSFLRFLDLDHCGAKIGEHHRSRRVRQQSRQIENGYTIEGFCHRNRAREPRLGSGSSCSDVARPLGRQPPCSCPGDLLMRQNAPF